MASVVRKAVIDRIEDGAWAVLLVGRKQTERILPVEELPEGAVEGTWLRVRIKDDVITKLVVDTAETEKVQRRIRSKVGALRTRRRRLKPRAPDEEKSESSASIEKQEGAEEDDKK
jgi:hypothetical protein